MKPIPTIERVCKILKFDPENGLFFWINPPATHPHLIMSIAGAITTGYVLIKIDNHRYKAHHLAWLITHGEWPPCDIDHKNGLPLDNRPCNLRLCTNAQNQANKRRIKGKVLPKGVRSTANKKYQARISFNKNLINLGTFDSLSKASAAYTAASKKYYGEFSRSD